MDELINGLRALLESGEDCSEAIRIASSALKESGVEATIESDDDAPDDNSDSDALWVVSTHRLLLDGEEVAEWTRCSIGQYGEAGRQCSEDDWCVLEDTDGGDTLPDGVAVALKALGLEDDIPDVPEPAKATDMHQPSASGEYGVYWETVGDDAHVMSRYATLEAATAVCDQRNREFAARNPSSGCTTYLCGYGVRQLVDGEWQRVDDDN